MHILILIKQVPETDKVKMDPETGTMVRSGLESIVNPLDLYAIEEALILKEQFGAHISVLSMGPPDAERALREALSMGCDEAILLTDRIFAGSDTWATSHVLAEAIKKIGAFDIILAGERATDGDTGQVGPAVAAWLDIPVISYASKIEMLLNSDSPRVKVRRLTEEGYQIIETETPCLMTVIKEIASPRLPTLRGKKYAKSAGVLRWSANDLNIKAEDAGLPGSPTRVTKIFYPKVSRDGECIVAKDERVIAHAVDRILEVLEEKGCLAAAADGKDAPDTSEYIEAHSAKSAQMADTDVASDGCASSTDSAANRAGVWIVAERHHNSLDIVSLELLARARSLADALHVRLAAVVLAPSLPSEEARSLMAHGADDVIVLESPIFSDFVCETWAAALLSLAKKGKPEIVLAAATTIGRTLMPYLAVQLNTGLTADCTELAIEEGSGLLLQTRPAIGGNIMATIKTPRQKPQMATVRPHSAQPLSPDYSCTANVQRVRVRIENDVLNQDSEIDHVHEDQIQADIELRQPRARVLSIERSTQDFENLEGARMVVAGGRGLKKAENFKLIRELADVFGAVVGASREAVDRGWISYPHQVGLSGKTISPDIYLCAGISGAIQHLAGIRTAKTVIAINSDAEAPIHAVADLAIVGDLFEILPRLTERLRSKKVAIGDFNER